jgi:riboflavin synthase
MTSWPSTTSPNMFTGLVDDIGVIEQISTTAAGREFRLRCRYTDLVEGESIALNGACLTVRERGAGWFSAAAVVTTLDRTTIGGWQQNQRVNLERAMRPTDRLGGHIVQGHVDGVGTVVSVKQRDDAWLIRIAVPPEIEALLVPQGSVTVEGVSLTINELPAPGQLGISIIEYTWQHTTLADLHPDDRVHIESDVIGKFVQRMVQPYLASLPTTDGSVVSSPQQLGTAMGLFRSLGQ